MALKLIDTTGLVRFNFIYIYIYMAVAKTFKMEATLAPQNAGFLNLVCDGPSRGVRGGALVEALRNKPEGRGIDSR
jgi:hypothetical protein